MASPPYIHQYGNSASPPYPQNNSLPRKRPSDVPASAPIIKKRKSSIASISTSFSHPLRQTSFPPEAAYGDGTRSPSVDTASLVSGSVATAPVKGKRGRKPKNKGEDASNVSTKAGGTNTGGGKDKGRKADEEEDDEDEGVDNMAVTTVARTNEEKEKEKQHRALLVSAFDDAQFSRYEVWRSSRLPDAVVRRLVNQTLSQSVPATVIVAVKAVTKIFAGEIIERARKVQSQWLDLSKTDEVGTELVKRIGPPKSDEDAEYRKSLSIEQRGPLTPEHLREALRRIKLERLSSVGLLGLGRSQHSTGQDRFGIKMAGKRLFR